MPQHALGSRNATLEAAGQQWHEPSLLSSLSVELCSAKALGTPQGKGGEQCVVLQAGQLLVWWGSPHSLLLLTWPFGSSELL